jgi:hypothetical protein
MHLGRAIDGDSAQKNAQQFSAPHRAAYSKPVLQRKLEAYKTNNIMPFIDGQFS